MTPQHKKKRTGALKKHLLELYLLSNAKPAARKKLLQKASQRLVRAICQCSKKILKGEAGLSVTEVNKLKKHKKKLKKLASKGPIASKKALLQKGGFAWLLPLVAPLISGLIGGIAGKR